MKDPFLDSHDEIEIETTSAKLLIEDRSITEMSSLNENQIPNTPNGLGSDFPINDDQFEESSTIVNEIPNNINAAAVESGEQSEQN